MADNKYFDGEINEYVDWISGYNEVENIDVTQGKQVAGGPIRRLLQGHMQKPFVFYHDPQGFNLLFSSAHALLLWKSDPTTYDDLVLARFQAAADYSIFLYNSPDPDAQSITLRSVYVKSGDTTANENFFRQYYKIFKGDKEYYSNVFVQFTVKNSNYSTETNGASYDSGEQIEYNLSSMLHKGTNTVDVTISAYIDNQVFYDTFRYTITVIELNTTVTYAYNKSGGSSDSYLAFRVRTVNTSEFDLHIKYKVDDYDEKEDNEAKSNQINDYRIYYSELANFEEGVHTLQVMGYVEVINGTKVTKIPSNIVYIKFAKYVGDTTKNDIVLYASIEDKEDSTSLFKGDETPCITLIQYKEYSMDWALASTQTTVSKDVTWTLYRELLDGDPEIVDTKTQKADKEKIYSWKYVPLIYGNTFKLKFHLQDTSEEKDVLFDVIIEKAAFQVTEATGYTLKLENTLGYNNSITENHKWKSIGSEDVSCLFNRLSSLNQENPKFPWNSKSGWGSNYMHISPGDYIYIPYRFFAHNNESTQEVGATIEIEFEFRAITNPDDEVIVIGGGTNKSKIALTPNSATLYQDGGEALITTNYKTNERIKLAFVIYPNIASAEIIQESPADRGLAVIVNNGILERVNAYGNNFTSDGGIKIGKVGAGAEIYIYKIRAWDRALLSEDLFGNYAIDNPETATIISNNNVVNSDKTINYKSTLAKLPVISITGDMAELIATKGKTFNLNVDLAKIDMRDSNKNMYITECRIRKHGQSTLNYPIPSFKIWSYSKNGYKVNLPGHDQSIDHFPVMNGCTLDDQGIPAPNAAVRFHKGRYAMKDGAIPANKWVLQANYADSSGVHNGGIQKLITDAWYNAYVEVYEDQVVDGNTVRVSNHYYKLRTPPQLITSIKSNRAGLDERDFYSTPEDIQLYLNWAQGRTDKKKSMYEYQLVNGEYKVKLWDDCNIGKFPYNKIRISTDSFPCVVFYRPTESDPYIFLGQYVFMDDKKSDYIYGERSIYKVVNDPFCLSDSNSSNDTAENRLWNNNYCRRIEVVKIDLDIVGYRSGNYRGKGFTETVTVYQTNDQNQYINADGEVIEDPETEGGVPIGVYPNWYNGFELVYPDVDDLKDQSPAGVNAVAESFITFHSWLVSTYDYFISQGGTEDNFYNGSDYQPSHPGFTLFRQEAADHLDLYKLAAYYICFLRFGLVDSVERNAQLKTYDGKHWHYEPWDMDIALGNKNTGGIKWNPPLTRATNDGSTAAYSGTHIDEHGNIDFSNWLWDALESWQEWQDIVRRVADALSTTLTYNNICQYLDKDYAKYWCERLYNISGHFKYIETKGDNMYAWLQGARTSHRHWWLKTSMDYYDARWVCGDYRNTGSYINLNWNGDNVSPLLVRIQAATQGYFCYGKELKPGEDVTIQRNSLTPIAGGNYGNVEVPKDESLNPKAPFVLFGATNIKELDLSDLYEHGSSGGVENIKLGAFSDPVSGVSLKTLNIGVSLNKLRQHITNSKSIKVTEGMNVMRNVEVLNIQGCANDPESSDRADYGSFLNHTEHLRRLYAIGTIMLSFKSNNYDDLVEGTVYRGGHYELLQLPDTVNTLEFHDSSWNEYDGVSAPDTAEGLSFWNYDKIAGTITNVPFADSGVTSLSFYGDSLSNFCAVRLLKEFINKAYASGDPGDYSLYFEGLVLDQAFYTKYQAEFGEPFEFTYNDLEHLHYLNSGRNSGKDIKNDKVIDIPYTFKGYLLLSSIGTSDPAEIATRIQNISTWFGTNVFNKNALNDNLVVDFEINGTDLYVSIDSYRGDCYNHQTNTIIEGYTDPQTCTSPNAVLIRASKFMLPDNPETQQLEILNDSSQPVTTYYGAYVGTTEGDLTLFVPEMQRKRTTRTQPSQLTLRITSRATSGGGSPTTKVVDVNVRHKVYPSSIELAVQNQDNFYCVQDRTGNVIDVNLNTGQARLTLNLNYPAGTAEEDKISIKEIKFLEDHAVSQCKLTPLDKYHAAFEFSGDIPEETPVEYKLLCKVVYYSGDELDDLVVTLRIVRDDVILTNMSNGSLYNVLDYLEISALKDSNNIKYFTKSSLASIKEINFSSTTPSDTYGTLLAGVTSFLIDTTDATKGTLFDYINSNTTMIKLNGCTNVALQSLETMIDATRFNILNTMECTSSAKIGFVYYPSQQNYNLRRIVISNADTIQIRSLSNLMYFDVQNAIDVEIQDIAGFNNGTFNLTLSSSLTKLILKNIGAEYLTAADIFDYIVDYIGDGTVPPLILMDLKWSGVTNVDDELDTMSTLSRYISTYSSDITNYLKFNNCQIAVQYYYANVKAIYDTYYKSLVLSWGTQLLYLSPDVMNDYVEGLVSGRLITPLTLSEKGAASLLRGFRSAHSGDCASITDLYWLINTKGETLNQSDKIATWYPNVRYLGWPLSKDNGVSFAENKYSELKADILITTNTAPPSCDQNGSFELDYGIIVISSECMSDWYYFLAAKYNNGQSGHSSHVQPNKETDEEKIAQLELVHIYCRFNGNYFTDATIKNIPTATLDQLYAAAQSPGHVYEVNQNGVNISGQ